MEKHNYRLQPGCYHCKHVFEMSEYSNGTTCFCTLDSSPRPLCGSVAMDEEFPWVSDLASELRYTESDHYWIAYNAWEEWSKDRQVVEFGICDKYDPKEK